MFRCLVFKHQFILQSDASDVGLGIVLTQNLDSQEYVVAYVGRTFRHYSATEKECLVVIWGIEKMCPYFEGYRFKVITDFSLDGYAF